MYKLYLCSLHSVKIRCLRTIFHLFLASSVLGLTRFNSNIYILGTQPLILLPYSKITNQT